MDHVEAALEACCAALITVQLLGASASMTDASAGGGGAGAASSYERSSLRETITSLQCAIDHLRSALNPQPHPPILGFVLRAPAEPSGTAASLSTQSRPRRTA